MIFDLSKRKSFENLDNWRLKIVDNCKETVFVILVGNKCDLPNREVTYDEGASYAKTHGLSYMEISAKTGQNLDNTF